MARFGGNEFSSFSVPLVFDGRYFVLEPGDPALLSVFIEREGEAVFEVLKNKGVNNPITEVASNATGVLTVTDKASGKIDGGEISARVSDRSIQVGGVTVENNWFHGAMAGVVVQTNGGVGIGAPIPPEVLKLLQGAS